uniref:Uncharacterized protein n=1 Tax=Candidatus Berkiella aquae TaxID=295108 RepID=A0A0Q9YXE2_9GAMM
MLECLFIVYKTIQLEQYFLILFIIFIAIFKSMR